MNKSHKVLEQVPKRGQRSFCAERMVSLRRHRNIRHDLKTASGGKQGLFLILWPQRSEGWATQQRAVFETIVKPSKSWRNDILLMKTIETKESPPSHRRLKSFPEIHLDKRSRSEGKESKGEHEAQNFREFQTDEHTLLLVIPWSVGTEP